VNNSKMDGKHFSSDCKGQSDENRLNLMTLSNVSQNFRKETLGISKYSDEKVMGTNFLEYSN
jgi:hypothetical protein